MSINRTDMNDGAHDGASHLLARGADDDVRADRRIRAAIDDFLLSNEARLDDRVRAGLDTGLAQIVAAVEGEVRQHAARQLAARGDGDLATMLASGPPLVLDRLISGGLLRDTDLMRELLGRARQDAMADALPSVAPDMADKPSLLARLVGHADPIVAAAASAMMAAEARRRAGTEAGIAPRSDLPAELHHQLVWWTAAVLRERFARRSDGLTIALDRALTEAALRSLAAHDEGERLEAVAMRLAASLDPHADELPALLSEALGDRRVSLFIALLAHALGLGYDLAREITLDPVADRLWLVLRAVALDRATIATIGLALCDSDPRRDLDAFADLLDSIAAVTPEDARDALAPLRLHPDFHASVRYLARTRAA